MGMKPDKPKTQQILRARCMKSGRRWILWKLETGELVFEKLPNVQEIKMASFKLLKGDSL